MKRNKRVLKTVSVLLLLTLLFTAVQPLVLDAGVPYNTWTKGLNGFITETQTAYLPDQVWKLGLNSPEDLCAAPDGTIYICDTGNGRIVGVRIDGTTFEISGKPLVKPTGIFVTESNIYVADYGAAMIHIYDLDGTLVESFGKPQEVLFGSNTKFLPRKLTVDFRGNLYVVSEGSISGLMQLNNRGEFLGYFGSNQTNTTLKMILQKTFFTEEQMNKLFKNTPPSIANVTIDNQGLIYTVTKANVDDPVKKLSIAGNNLFPAYMDTDYQIVDAAVDADGNTYTISSNGRIYEYDSYGELLFIFGSKETGLDRMGLVAMPAAIDITRDGRLIVLDQVKGMVQLYRTTEFADRVHEGIRLYKAGLYEQSEELWQEIKKSNSSFVMAYEALGKASFKKQEYAEAMEYYKIAGNKGGYSQTLWENRNQWLTDNLGTAILILFALFVLWKAVQLLDRKKGILAPVRRPLQKVTGTMLWKQMFFGKKLMRHPVDCYYDLKYKRGVSVKTATCWYLWLFVLQLTGIYVTGYIFNDTLPQYRSLGNELLWVVLPVGLWLICNYLVSTITDGKGKFKDIYCGTIYAFSPYLYLALPIQILSNILTQNEAFVFSYGFLILYAWSAILFFIMIKEIHEYSGKQAVKNILLTLFTILLFVLLAFILYLLFQQMKDFLVSVVKEVGIRA